MKIAQTILVSTLLLTGCGQKPTTPEPQNGRYEIHSLSWDSIIESSTITTTLPHHDLVKIDTQTGRVWTWDEIQSTNGFGRWNELIDYKNP